MSHDGEHSQVTPLCWCHMYNQVTKQATPMLWSFLNTERIDNCQQYVKAEGIFYNYSLSLSGSCFWRHRKAEYMAATPKAAVTVSIIH